MRRARFSGKCSYWDYLPGIAVATKRGLAKYSRCVGPSEEAKDFKYDRAMMELILCTEFLLRSEDSFGIRMSTVSMSTRLRLVSSPGLYALEAR